jgi:hypothetical protein
MEEGTAVKVTNKVLFDIWPILMKAMNTPMKSKAAYNIKRNFDTIQSVIRVKDGERMELFKKYGTYEVDHDRWSVENAEPEKKKEFLEALNTLMASEVEFKIRPIRISQLASEATFTPNELQVLDFMLTDDKLIVEASQIIH